MGSELAVERMPAVAHAILLLSLGAPGFARANPTCQAYEPAQVTIEGVIERKTFAGPPNYENIESGDRAETYWILNLKSPICVDGPPDELNSPERDVSQIQLVLKREHYERFAQLVGRRARAAGTLFHAISGHHHTSVLLTVDALSPAPPSGR